MYLPVRPRPKKTDIIRSRNGCKSCRQRRTKVLPPGLGKTCERFSEDLQFRVVTSSDPRMPKRLRGKDRSHTRLGLSHVEPEGVSCGSMDLIRSLQHTERDVFYLTYWEDQCLPTLHPILRFFTQSAAANVMLKNTMLALSACNLSRLNPEVRMRSESFHMGKFRPNLIHQTRSQLYYSAAISRLVNSDQLHDQRVAITVLAVIVILSYMESSMSNFTAFYCHTDGLFRFLTNLNDYAQDETVRGLLTTWMQSRLSVWWMRSYFSSVKLQRLLPSIPLPRILQGQPKSLHERRVEIMSIMCDSHYLSNSCILRHWDCEQSTETVIPEPSDAPGTDALHFHVLLAHQVQRLDRWIQHLSPAEQPLMDSASTGDITTPLRFTSHDAALNYAYYLTSCILQCQTIFCTLPPTCPTIATREGQTADPYVGLLLRIAKASPPAHHLKQNIYTIGFTNLLLTALLRTTSVSLAIEIENFVQSLADTLPTEEGGFPIYQALAVIKLINVRKMAGKDVVAVSQPVDDHGGEPKFQSFNSQAIRDLFFHGKERTGGALFKERVVIGRAGKLNGGEWRWGRGRRRPVIYVSRFDGF
ncbi:hypothetical protein AnigIFM63604_003563 [Aspergillus niger]|uniref:Transcription factor domain-containing protein n=1 Tax=Aspergillus niger TaxID=5061 RepID=A0A9W5ZRN4_ASPNG|nr:hypothetical protein AnigIFM63604_003563 [Aspergillus niger]